MRNKGFTLVELVAVIIILGMIALIVTPVITDVITNSKEKIYKQQIEEVLRSAERWAMSNSTILPQEDQAVFYLSVPSLKDDGFVKDKDIMNPVTDAQMNGCILITYQADSLQYDYSYEETSCSSTHAVENLTNVYPEYACYTFDSVTGTITNYDTINPICVKDVFIPNKIDGVAVSIIGVDAFRNKDLTSVTLPNSIVTIGDYAFAENTLVTLKLKDLTNLVTIGQYAFAYNTIASINLTGLTSLNLINVGAFTYNNITSLNLLGLNNLENIQDDAFSYNNLTTLNISGLTRLEQIHSYSFSHNAITSLIVENLPDLYDIESGAFSANLISNLVLRNIPQLNYIYDAVFYDNSLTAIDLSGLPQIQYIGDSAFKSNDITSLDLSGFTNLQRIEDEAFEYNPIISLDLSDLPSLTTIALEAFKDNRLSTVTIPATVTTIGTNAFLQSSSYPWSGVTILSNGTNLATRFNATWATTGWPSNLMPS